LARADDIEHADAIIPFHFLFRLIFRLAYFRLFSTPLISSLFFRSRRRYVRGGSASRRDARYARDSASTRAMLRGSKSDRRRSAAQRHKHWPILVSLSRSLRRFFFAYATPLIRCLRLPFRRH